MPFIDNRNTDHLINTEHYSLVVRSPLKKLESLLDNTSPVEKSYTLDARHEDLRQQRANCYDAIRVNINTNMWVDHKENGQPLLMLSELKSPNCISISHKPDAVAVVIANSNKFNVGVDIEPLNTFKDYTFLTNIFISESEIMQYPQICKLYELSLSDCPLFFWTLKEAALKALSLETSMAKITVQVDQNKKIQLILPSRGDSIYTAEIILYKNFIIAIVTIFI